MEIIGAALTLSPRQRWHLTQRPNYTHMLNPATPSPSDPKQRTLTPRRRNSITPTRLYNCHKMPFWLRLSESLQAHITIIRTATPSPNMKLTRNQHNSTSVCARPRATARSALRNSGEIPSLAHHVDHLGASSCTRVPASA